MFISMIKYLNYKWQLKVANARLLLDQANNRISEEKIKKEHKEHLMMRRAGLDKIKLKAEEILAEAQTETAKKRVVVQDFDSGAWGQSSREYTRNVARKKAIAFQMQEKYKYITIINEWEAATDSANYPSRSQCTAAFSNSPIEIFNANDEVIKILLNEVKEVIPQLLIHPDVGVRAIAEKITKELKSDPSL